MKTPVFKSLRTKLLLFISVLVLLTVGIFIVIIIDLQELSFSRIMRLNEAHVQGVLNDRWEEKGKVIVTLLSDNLIQPVHNLNMPEIQYLAMFALEQKDVKYVYIQDEAGRVLSDGTTVNVRVGRLLSDPVSRAAVASGSIMVQRLGDIADIAAPVMLGDKRLATVRIGLSLEGIQDTAAGTIRKIHDDIDDAVAETIKRMLLAALMVGTIALALGFAFARRFLSPITMLIQGTRKVSEGDLLYKIEVGSGDEIGQLAASFNKMTGDLHRENTERKMAEVAIHEALKRTDMLNRELESYNRTLEQKVEERTRELREMNAKLRELDRMKTDFLATVSHEIRTPLASVRGFVFMIKRKLHAVLFPAIAAGDEKVAAAKNLVERNIEIIESESERLANLIDDVLDIAKMEAGKIEYGSERFSLSEAVEQALSVTSALLEQKGLSLVRDIGGGDCEVVGDKRRLMQVMVNLLSNAVKFTEEGSITCRLRRTADEVEVSIIDTGSGIAAENREKIFDKFKQLGDVNTNKPKGTGLGLAICKQIVEHHGGRIWVESENGAGSAFSFTVPAKGI